jgi:histidinol-phosphate aminotransferase
MNPWKLPDNDMAEQYRSYERANVRRMKGYASGEQPDDDHTIKLNTNENPYPPSAAVASVIRGLDATSLRRYPPPTANAFRDLAAARHNVERQNVIATRGGDELLRLIITTFVDPGETIAMSDPTYSLYPVLAQIQDCPAFKIPLAEDWSIPPDFADQANGAAAKLTLIVNPHAPSGRLLDVARLAAIASSLTGLLLIDEAYVDFVDPAVDHSTIDLIRQMGNVLILRSLSKGYSLAGLRFGYGIGPTALIEPMLQKTRDSYNLDFISQKIAEAAFVDYASASASWVKVRSERARLATLLMELGLPVVESEANFLLATFPPGSGTALNVYQRLKQMGILVRYFSEPRLTDKLRITVGTPEENDSLIAALRQVIYI